MNRELQYGVYEEQDIFFFPFPYVHVLIVYFLMYICVLDVAVETFKISNLFSQVQQ